MLLFFVFFFFNDTATTEIYTLSLHDALPISAPRCVDGISVAAFPGRRHEHRLGVGNIGKTLRPDSRRFALRFFLHGREPPARGYSPHPILVPHPTHPPPLYLAPSPRGHDTPL